jgi:putative aldouronate transport system substrate-binding protein
MGMVDPAAGITTLNDVLAWQVIEQKTGVHIEWIHPPFGQEQESFNLLIASGDYPDLIINPLYTGGLDQAIGEEVFLRLNELIDQYAPNYAELRTRNPDVARGTITDSGNLAAFYSINTPIQGPWYGMAVRKDWLDELGLSLPVTYDDWYAMLRAFKEKKGADAPFWFSQRNGDMFGVFAAGYGITGLAMGIDGSFFQVNGRAKYSPLEPGFKEYITMLAKWYAEGLIDRDYYTRNDYVVPGTLLDPGNTGAFPDIYTIMGYRAYMSGDLSMNVVPVPGPVKKAGDRLHLRQYNFERGNNHAVITTACKDPALAVRWLDYLCSDEGSLIQMYGVEGDTYNMIDGKPVPSEKLTANPEGLDVNVARVKYLNGISMGKYYWERELVGLPQTSLDAITTVWPSNADGDWEMPQITRTAEEGNRFARIMGDVDTYALEMSTKFIIGAEPLGNYDAFVAALKQMGAEEAVAIQQAALDRYYSRGD